MSSQGTKEVEISIDDIRRFMGEEQPADIAKKYFNTELPVDPDIAIRNEQKNLAKIAEVERNLALRDDKTKREDIINELISQKHSGALSLKREEEELQQLQQLETRLRDESMKLEDERRSVNTQLKQSKKEEVELIERQVQQDMIVLEEQRVRIEKELARKQENIGALRSNMHEIETEMDDAYNKRNDDISNAQNAHENTADERKRQFQVLNDQHTRKVAQNQAYSYSIDQEQRLLDSGDYKIFNNLVVNDALKGSNGSVASRSNSSAQSNAASAGALPPPVSALTDPGVTELLTEYGLKKQGDKVNQMKQDAQAKLGANAGADFDLGSDFEKDSSKIANRIRLLKEGKSVPMEAEVAAAAAKDNKLASYSKGIGKIMKSDGTADVLSGGVDSGASSSSIKLGNMFKRKYSKEYVPEFAPRPAQNEVAAPVANKAPLNMVSQLDMWLGDNLNNPLSSDATEKPSKPQALVKETSRRSLELQKKGELISSNSNNGSAHSNSGLPTTMEEMQAEILRLRKLKFQQFGADDSSEDAQSPGLRGSRQGELPSDRRSGRKSNISYSAAKVQDPSEWREKPSGRERNGDREKNRRGHRRSDSGSDSGDGGEYGEPRLDKARRGGKKGRGRRWDEADRDRDRARGRRNPDSVEDRSDMDEYLSRRHRSRRDRRDESPRVRKPSPISEKAYNPPQAYSAQQQQPPWLAPYPQMKMQQPNPNPYGMGYPNPNPYAQDPYGMNPQAYDPYGQQQQQQMQQQQMQQQQMQQQENIDVRSSRDSESNNIAPRATRKLARGPPSDIRRGRGGGEEAPARLTRAEQKHQQELQSLQFEMEMMKKKHEFSEFKEQLEKQRMIKMNEMEHDHWLQQQQNELEQIKMKQAIAKEQKLLNIQLAADKAAAVALEPPPPVVPKVDAPVEAPKTKPKSAMDLLRSEAGVVGAYGDSLVPVDVLKGVLVYADAVIIPKSVVALGTIPPPGTLAGDTQHEVVFRLALGIYDSKGKLLSRLGASDWQPMEALESDGGNGEVLCPLHVGLKKVVKKLFADPDIVKRETKALVELQTKSVPMGTPGGAQASFAQNTLGWAVAPLFIYLPQDGSLHLNNGFWRAPLRKGAADGNIDPASMADGLSNAWVLFRVCDHSDAAHANDWQLFSAIKQPTNAGILSTTYHALQAYNEVYGGATSSSQPPVINVEPVKPPSSNRRSSLRPPSTGVQRPPTGASVKPPSSRSLRPPTQPAATPQPVTVDSVVKSPTPTSKMSFGAAGRLVKSMSRPKSMTPPIDEEKDDSSSDEEVVVETGKNKMGWIIGTPTGPASVKYERGDGVDIYIDSAMFLPDNCTGTRCVLKLYSRENEQIGETFVQYADASSPASHPVFAFKTELRSSTSLDVTMTALVRLDTVDYQTLETLCTGYGIFKVFCTKTRAQPTAMNQPDAYVNTGAFQLPLMGGKPSRPTDGMDDTMLATLPRIPCATLLVRILPAPKSAGGMSVLCKEDLPKEEWVSSGLEVPAPLYNSGAYDGKAAEPEDGVENVCYLSKQHNALQSIDAAISAAVNLAGTQSTKNSGGVSPRSTAAAFPQRPSGLALNDERMVSWIEKIFQPATAVRNTIDYSYAVPYSPDSGLSISIEGLNNMPDISGFFSSACNVYKVIYSICPPGMFYMNPPITNANVQFTRGNNLDCPVKSGRFTDGFSNFFPQLNGQGENNESLWLILDVRTVRVDPPKGKDPDPILTIEPVTSTPGSGNTKNMKSYWTILPLFKERAHGQGFKYVATGVYTLPLLEGAVPTELITALNDPYQDMLQKLSGISLTDTGPMKTETATKANPTDDPKLRLNTDGSTILVRVSNPQVTKLESELVSNIPEMYEKHLDTRFVTEILAAYRKNTSKDKGVINDPLFSWDNSSSINNKSLEDMLVKYDAKKVIKEINKVFGKATAISY